VSSNLSPAELAALREGREGRAADPSSEVSPWELGRIRRLSADDVAEATRSLERALPHIEARLREIAGIPIQVRLAACHEIASQTLLDGVVDPLALVAFEVDGQPGWCLWDAPMAVATLQSILVGLPKDPAPTDAENAEGEAAAESAAKSDDEEPAPPARPPFDPLPFTRLLTPIERRVLVRVIGLVIDQVAAIFRVSATKHVGIELRKHAPTWRETGGTKPDPYRLAIDLTLATDLGESTVSIYLPMSGSRAPLGAEPTKDRPTPSRAPEHLDPIPLAVTAVLGHAELSLADLMALEVGDVVPLDASVGDPIQLFTSAVAFARGRIGTHRGRVAVSLLADVQSPAAVPPQASAQPSRPSKS
jgi:flagellar motor switch/type III secretory pathway protein FliN